MTFELLEQKEREKTTRKSFIDPDLFRSSDSFSRFISPPVESKQCRHTTHIVRRVLSRIRTLTQLMLIIMSDLWLSPSRIISLRDACNDTNIIRPNTISKMILFLFFFSIDWWKMNIVLINAGKKIKHQAAYRSTADGERKKFEKWWNWKINSEKMKNWKIVKLVGESIKAKINDRQSLEIEKEKHFFRCRMGGRCSSCVAGC